MMRDKSKAKFGVAAFVVLSTVLAFTGCVSAKTITVDDNPGMADYEHIQDAVDAAVPGDIIYVYEGLYIEHVVIDKCDSIQLIGDDRENVVIDGGWSGTCITIKKDYITVANFTMQNGENGIYITADNCLVANNTINFNDDGIVLFGDKNRIVNNKIASNSGSGIYLSGCDYNEMMDNEIMDNSNGIYLDWFNFHNEITHNDITSNINGIYCNAYCDGSKIANNNVTDNSNYGIYLHWCAGSQITNNNIRGNGNIGISLSGAQSSEITNNKVISNSGDGIRLSGDNNRNSKITNNEIIYNKGYGVYLYDGEGSEIANNNIDSNKDGIYLGSSGSSKITENTVNGSNNGLYLTNSPNNRITDNNVTYNKNYGIYLKSGSSLNDIYHNCFIDNGKQAEEFESSNTFDNGSKIGGNYWSDHVCTGNPSNGSQPYIIPPYGHKDRYPFEHCKGWLIELPDLMLLPSDISFASESPIEGELVTINAAIHNIGGGNASDVAVRFFDGADQIGSDQVIGFIDIGGEATVSVAWNTTGEAGDHVITVKVDPDNEIEERSETNNEASKEITVSEPTTEIEVTTDRETYYPADTMQVKICIKNIGPSRSVMLGWWLTVPKLGYASVMAYAPMTLSEDYEECFDIPISVGYWGASGFGAVWGAGLFNTSTGEIIDYDTSGWNYMPGATAEEKIPSEIEEEIKKAVESVELKK